MGIRKSISSKFASTHNSPIIVVGMHRSGTTLLTRLLQRAGVNMGNQQSKNAESELFQSLNKRILNSVGASWRCIEHLPPPGELKNIFQEKIVAGIKRSMTSQLIGSHIGYRAVLCDVIGGETTWGWKDPRNTLLLPIWKNIFPESRIVHIYRDGRDCAVSLLKREFANFYNTSLDLYNPYHIDKLKKDFNLWEKYIKYALSVRNTNSCFLNIRFESLVENPNKVTNRILEKIDIEKRKHIGAEKIVDQDVLKKRFEGENKRARDLIPSSNRLKELKYI